MTKKTYSELLKHPLWQKKRLEIMKRDKFRCRKCGDEETTLNVHHKYYLPDTDPWNYPNISLITLCEDCHCVIEKIKKNNNKIDIDSIKLYKSIGWTDGSKILFVKKNDICLMQIISSDGSIVTGFNIPKYEATNIIKILKSILK